jgi:hypothetical protein
MAMKLTITTGSNTKRRMASERCSGSVGHAPLNRGDMEVGYALFFGDVTAALCAILPLQNEVASPARCVSLLSWLHDLCVVEAENCVRVVDEHVEMLEKVTAENSTDARIGRLEML